VLAEGDLLGIFPEGGITKDGTLQPFKGGLMKILERQPAPVIPVALNNLWGSYFSRIEGGQAMVKPFRRGLFSRVGLSVGPALAAGEVTPEGLRERAAGSAVRLNGNARRSSVGTGWPTQTLRSSNSPSARTWPLSTSSTRCRPG
jgi:1-acyl-sn-glycerol-3-phosphate acyltransferase